MQNEHSHANSKQARTAMIKGWNLDRINSLLPDFQYKYTNDFHRTTPLCGTLSVPTQLHSPKMEREMERERERERDYYYYNIIIIRDNIIVM